MNDKIKIKGAREHNLKNVNLEIPRDKMVVFTGELKDFSRSQAEDLVRRLGGNAASSVSKNTDFVVRGENPGSKYEKAVKLGINIIDEAKFKEMVK